YPAPVNDTMLIGRAVLERKVLQVVPLIGNPNAPAKSEAIARKYGYNAMIVAPMLREDKVVGAIATARREATPFDEKQISLIKSFADQAVIAIENARLVNETRESL